MKANSLPPLLGSFAVLAIALLGINASGFFDVESKFVTKVLHLEPLQGQESAGTTPGRQVPPPIKRSYSTRVVVEFEIREHVKMLADQVSYVFWTFGDSAPGAFIRVREGDLVEVRLHNHPDNIYAHNIDFQSASGPNGGGDASFVAPGSSSVFTWRATRPGLYLYKSNASPPGVHVANGMYGQILVEPSGGLPAVDREFQIVQSEFYTEGKFGEPGPQRFSMEKAVKEQPEYVVFNGRVGAVMGDNALTAKVGERVRIFFGNAGPNLVSSFHIVGEIFDAVYGEGGTSPNQRNVQTTVVPSGGSAIVEFTVDVPGDYTLVDHAMFRAFNKGATGMLRVQGDENPMLFSGRRSVSRYNPETRLPKIVGFAPSGGADGAKIYASICVTCHQANGEGIPGAFPPLAKSDFLMADRERAIRILLAGLRGKVLVNGKIFDGIMPNPRLDDAQIASVLSYVLSNFGNNGQEMVESEVTKLRSSFDISSPVNAEAAWAKPSPAPAAVGTQSSGIPAGRHSGRQKR